MRWRFHGPGCSAIRRCWRCARPGGAAARQAFDGGGSPAEFFGALAAHYGGERYRTSVLIQRRGWTRSGFRE